MADQEETLLEPIEEIQENNEIEEQEYGSESETGSNIEEDDLTTVGGELPDIDDFEDEPYMMDMGGLLSSVLATEEGDTVCSALVNISRQMEVQNKILINILSVRNQINVNPMLLCGLTRFNHSILKSLCTFYQNWKICGTSMLQIIAWYRFNLDIKTL